MNFQQNTILMILTLLGAAALASFAGSAADRIPKGWSKDGTRPHIYEVALDAVVKHSDKASAYIKSVGPDAVGFCTLMQSFKANGYHGKRLRMSAWVRTENADSAQLWLRLDSANGIAGFDNMNDRLVKGTVDWKKYELVLDVPTNTVNIAFGAILAGKGQAWVDDFVFEVVGKDTPSTNMLTPEQMKGGGATPVSDGYPAQPLNLNFEEDPVTPAENETHLARDKAAADDARSWLAANAIRLDTVEAGHGFADMQALKGVIGRPGSYRSANRLTEPASFFSSSTGCWNFWSTRWASTPNRL